MPLLRVTIYLPYHAIAAILEKYARNILVGQCGGSEVREVVRIVSHQALEDGCFLSQIGERVLPGAEKSHVVQSRAELKLGISAGWFGVDAFAGKLERILRLGDAYCILFCTLGSVRLRGPLTILRPGRGAECPVTHRASVTTAGTGGVPRAAYRSHTSSASRSGVVIVSSGRAGTMMGKRVTWS